MADNLEFLTAKVDDVIPTNGGVASVKTVKHNPFEKEIINTLGRNTGFPFLAGKLPELGKVPYGSMYWNGNAMNKEENFEIIVSELTQDGNKFLRIIERAETDDLIHFKDYTGKSVLLRYVGFDTGTDPDGKKFITLTVSGFSENTNYAYQDNEVHNCFMELVKNTKTINSNFTLLKRGEESPYVPGGIAHEFSMQYLGQYELLYFADIDISEGRGLYYFSTGDSDWHKCTNDGLQEVLNNGDTALNASINLINEGRLFIARHNNTGDPENDWVNLLECFNSDSGSKVSIYNGDNGRQYLRIGQEGDTYMLMSNDYVTINDISDPGFTKTTGMQGDSFYFEFPEDDVLVNLSASTNLIPGDQLQMYMPVNNGDLPVLQYDQKLKTILPLTLDLSNEDFSLLQNDNVDKIVNLPVGTKGKVFEVNNAGTGIITLTPNGLELINGKSNLIIPPGNGFTIKFIGSGWYITAKYQNENFNRTQWQSAISNTTVNNGTFLNILTLVPNSSKLANGTDGGLNELNIVSNSIKTKWYGSPMTHDIRVVYHVQVGSDQVYNLELRRVSDNSVISTSQINRNPDSDIATAMFSTYTGHSTDPFVTDGFYIAFNNQSGVSAVLTTNINIFIITTFK